MFSLERPLAIKGSPGGFASYVRPITAKQIVDKHTLRLKTAAPYGPLLQDLALVLIVSKSAAAQRDAARISTAARRRSAPGPSSCAVRARRPRASSRGTTPTGAAGPRGTRVTLRILPNDPDAHRRAAFGRARRDRERAHRRSRAAAQERGAPARADRFVAHDPSPSRPAPRRRRPASRTRRASRSRQPVQGSRACGWRCRRRSTARRSPSASWKASRCPPPNVVSPSVIGHDPAVKPEAYDPEGAKKLLAEAGYPERLHDDARGAQQPLRQRRAGRAGVRADVFAHRHHDQGRRDAGRGVPRQGAQPGIRRGAARLGLARRRPRAALARATPNPDKGYGTWNWARYSTRSSTSSSSSRSRTVDPGEARNRWRAGRARSPRAKSRSFRCTTRS